MTPTPANIENHLAVSQQVREWGESGVIERVADVNVAVNVVLIENAQSG